MKNEKLNIVILANGNFPIGMASTNRLVSYCRGLIEDGHNIKVVVLCPHEKEGEEVINKKVSGYYHGIEFQYASKTTIWPKSNLKKIWVLLLGLIRSIIITYNYNKKAKLDVLFFASGTTVFIYTIPFFILAKLIRTKLIREKSEYPIFELRGEKYSRIYRFLAKRYLFRFFDGLLLMTNPLIEYFKPIVCESTKLELVPMTVEPERFMSEINASPTKKYIAYCGYLWGNKDGVDILIRAFSLIANKHQEYKLYLIGDISNKVLFEKTEELVSSLKLTSRIVFTGRVSRDEMPKYLVNASLLALARPTSLQARGGFPTKLGEYLATGNPVVITRVGDIPLYLSDNETAFLADPDSAESFAERLDFALSNPENAIKVGLNGRKLSFGVFYYKTQSRRIAEFIRNL